MKQKNTILWTAAVAALLIATLWAHSRLTNASHAADQAATDLAECRKLALQIGEIKDRPRVAGEQEKLAGETTAMIDVAATAAGITARQLIRIAPESPQRLGETVYKEKPIAVLLRGVTLRQLVHMGHALLAPNPGLRIKTMRLSAPTPDDTTDKWTAELTITYLLYDPQTTVARASRP